MPPPAIEIRAATDTDIPTVVALWRELADFHAAASPRFMLLPDADATWRDHLTERLSRPDQVVLLALQDEVPVGFVMLRPGRPSPMFVSGRVAEITDMGVTQALRGQGIGTALWNRSLAWIRAAGFSHIDLGVAAGNDLAHEFWTGRGFTPRFQALRLDL